MFNMWIRCSIWNNSWA